MKKILFFLAFSLARLVEAQMTFPMTSGFPSIAAALFEGTYDSRTAYIKWKPNLHERTQFGDPQSVYLYTKIDTIFDHKAYGKEYKILVTNTFVKSGEPVDCHFCGPSFSIIELEIDPQTKKYKLEKFYKYVGQYGTFGNPDEVGILPLSNQKYLLTINGGYTQNGVSAEYVAYITNGENVFFVETEAHNGGEVGPDTERFYHFKTEVSVEQGDEFPLIIFTTEGTRPDFDNDGKPVSAAEKRHYQIKEGRFERQCD